MREKGQQSAKILTHLVTYRGKKEEKCLFLLYVGRCKGKTDICLFFFSFFFYEPFPNKVISYCSPDFTLISIFYWTFLQSWQPSWPKDRLSHDCWEPQFSHQLAGPQGFHAQGLIKHPLCLNSFLLNVMNLTLCDSHDPPCVIILTKISNYPTPPTILIPSRENLMKLEVWNGKPGLDSYTAGWWDHLHQHQPTESGGGHCRVWKQVVGTKSLVRKLKSPFSGGTWSMPWTSWTGRSWTGGGSDWLKRVAVQVQVQVQI